MSTTLRELSYNIEANTEGLNKAFPALDKLVGSLERLDKTVQSFNSKMGKGLGDAGKQFEGVGKGVEKGAAQIEAALKRQEAATISAQQKLISLNKSIKESGGDQKLITNNVQAYQQLEKALKDSSTTAAEATLAKAKYNAALNESKRSLMEYQAAQKQSEVAQKANDSALLKQSNTVARVRIQYENLVAALQSRGASPQKIQELTRSFDQFEKEMNSGVLSAQQYSESMNRMNGDMARVKRNSGFAAGLGAGMSELASSTQIALGPLSGVASRLTALTSLANATTIGLAGVVGAVITLGAAFVKVLRDGTMFEKQMGQINAILENTGNDAIISSRNVELAVRRVSQSTNALQSEVRDAAAGFLVINGLTDDLLESALKASQGLAIASGGSITSSYRSLARVLKDPVENINTLNEYGKSFNDTEKAKIKTLVESGKRHEAMVYILSRLQEVIASAEGETNSLAGAWNQLSDSVTMMSQDIAENSGLLDALAGWMKSSSRVAANVATGSNMIFNSIRESLGYEATNSVTTLQQRSIELYKTLQDVDGPIEKIGQVEDHLREVIRRIKEVEGTQLMPDVDMNDLQVAIDALNSGNIDAASRALEDYVEVVETAAKAEREHEIALEEAGNMLTKLKGEYLEVGSAQSTMQNKLTGLTDQWDLMVESMVNSGKTAVQAEATLRRLRQEIETSSGSVAAYVENLKRSTVAAQMEADISGMLGSEKRNLQVEQRILNDLWSSGVITSADFEQALIDLREMGFGPLAKSIEEASRALEKAEFAKKQKEMTRATEDAIAVAQKQAQVATKSAREQAEAMAVLAKQQELLSAGIDPNSDFWNQQIAAARQLVDLEFAASWAEDYKQLENAAKLAQITAEAAGKSALEEAMAIAVATEKLDMHNEGIKEGSALWNQRLALVRQMADLEFSAGHAEEMKALKAQAQEQQNILDSLFYSEKTRDRMLAQSQKEYELAEKYGSLMDERAQKELQMFEMLQARQKVISDWQEVANVIDNAFQTLEDSLVEFVKTGELNWRKFASAVLEDIFRMTLRMAVLDPLKDAIGGAMKGITGSGAGEAFAGAMPSMKDVLGTSPATPMFVSVVNDLAQMIPGVGAEGGGGVLDSVTQAGTSAAEGTFSGAPVSEVINKPLAPLADAAEDTSKKILDLGNGVSMTEGAFDYKMDLVTQEAEKVGQAASKSLIDVDYASKRVAQAHGDLSGTVDRLGGSLDNFGSTTNSAANALTENFSSGGQFEKIIQLSEQDVKDIMKVTQTEVIQGLKGVDFDKQVGGVVDTIINRKVSDQFPNDIRGVINQHRQFSKITGPSNLDPYGSVQNMPDSLVNQKTQDAVLRHLNMRGSGDSIVGGDLNYLNPKHSTWNNIKPGSWGENVVQDATKSGQIFGGGPNTSHFHGTAPGFTPVDSNYGVGLPQKFQGMGGSMSYQQLPRTMAAPPMNPMAMGQGGGMMPPSMPGLQGGGMMPGMPGMGGGGGVQELTSNINQLNGSFTSLNESLPEMTSSLTTGLDKAASSASELADSGLNQASRGMERLANDSLTQSIAAQAQTAASTQKMGTDTMVASAGVQQLGQAALQSAAQMQAGGVMGAVLHGGTGSGGVFMGSSKGWAGAPRLHGGLHSNEFRAILKRGEGVFTEEQMDMLGNAIKKNGETEDSGGGGGRQRRGGMGGPITVNLNGVKDFDSFRKSQAQLNAGMMSAAQQAMRNQG